MSLDLKTHLQNEWIKKYGVNSVTQPPVDYEITAVRAWLQEEKDAIPNRLEYYHSNDSEQMQTLGKVKMIDDLLRSLGGNRE